MINSEQAMSAASGAGRSWQIRRYVGAAALLLAGAFAGAAGVASGVDALVHDAYQRIVDLQIRGYAYIRF